MKIAVVGCLHGELDKVYDDIRLREQQQGCQVDLVLVCGDFQAVRNHHDLQCMAVPPKYRQLGQFHDYYYGRKKAPILTLFVGGNHEASNYVSSLAYGGWVADNIYYMGYASVVTFAGLRIAGVSGIYKKHDAHCGHYERLPYDGNSLRSVFHVRDLEIHRMKLINNRIEEQPIDIFMSHDWPMNIHANGTPQAINDLLRKKPFFRQEMENMCLGNPFHEPLMKHLKPRYWFAAHLHVRFEVEIVFSDTASSKFLALDKCLPRRQYLEILDIDPKVPGEKVLSYDAEWLAILRRTDRLLSVEKVPKNPIPAIWIDVEPLPDQEIAQVRKIWSDSLAVPLNFTHAIPALADRDTDPGRTQSFTNPQTTEFCTKNGITDPIAKIVSGTKQLENPDEINLDDDEEEEGDCAEPEDKQESGCSKKLKSEADKELAGGALFVIDKTGSLS